MAGRNSKLNEDVQGELTRLIGAGVFMNQACEYVGISVAAVYNWMARGSSEALRLEQNPKAKPIAKEEPYLNFFREMKKAENFAEIRAVTNWQKAIPDDWRAAKDFLARRYPDRWSPRLELTGADGGAIQTNLNVDVVTLEQKVLAVLEARNGRAISRNDIEIESD
jgi:transposase